MRVKDTRTNQLLEFKPLNPPKVNMFVCGPTVYDHAHIGHARTFIAFDIIARYLRYRGFELFYIMNITDIDDKIIKKAKEENSSWVAVARKYEKSFLEDMAALDNKDQINLFARATDYIPQIIDQISRLIERGYGYVTSSGVYYRVSKFEDYGKLSKINPEELLAGARVEVNEEKEDPRDFVLWKFRDPNDQYEPSWDSPWGPGRPGWHIEDTAITEYHFGPQYDIHGGAIELIFPHHEAEIAQMEGASGKKPLVRYWLHTGLLNISGAKMSKSLKNFITIKEALKKWDKNTLRMFIASAHYRNPIEFSEDLIQNAKQKVLRIQRFFKRLNQIIYTQKPNNISFNKDIEELLANTRAKFVNAMDNDFNTPEALSVVFDFIKKINKSIDNSKLDLKNARNILEFIQNEFFYVFGLSFSEGESTTPEILNDVINLLLEIRNELRKKKEYELSDKIRNKLKDLGIIIEDKGNNTTWSYNG